MRQWVDTFLRAMGSVLTLVPNSHWEQDLAALRGDLLNIGQLGLLSSEERNRRLSSVWLERRSLKSCVKGSNPLAAANS